MASWAWYNAKTVNPHWMSTQYLLSLEDDMIEKCYDKILQSYKCKRNVINTLIRASTPDQITNIMQIIKDMQTENVKSNGKITPNEKAYNLFFDYLESIKATKTSCFASIAFELMNPYKIRFMLNMHELFSSTIDQYPLVFSINNHHATFNIYDYKSFHSCLSCNIQFILNDSILSMCSSKLDDETKPKSNERSKSKICDIGNISSSIMTHKLDLEFLDGDLFHNKYIIDTKINEGGFGQIYKVREYDDTNDNTKCVKIMDLGKDSSLQIKRHKTCIREFEMTKRAFSDQMVQTQLFIDNIEYIEEPKAYLIMPYFQGKDLYDFIDDDNYLKKISLKTILDIFHKILKELYNLHYNKKIVHGDVKPENVILFQNDITKGIEILSVQLIDFGIAKSVRNLSSDNKYLKAKGNFGTKGYVAPELINDSKYNRKIDTFSVGVVLYNMMTECSLFPKGHKYFQLSQVDYYKYLKKKFKCIKKKKAVVEILYCCLAYNPDQRLTVKQLIERFFGSIKHLKQEGKEKEEEKEEEKEDNKTERSLSNTDESKTEEILDDVDGETVSSETNIAIIISDMMDEINEELAFQYEPVSVWRWDKMQNKWRTRGKGKLSVYYNKKKDAGKIMFVDNKYNKTRLLQWIDGDTNCVLMDDEVKWTVIHPMISNWKLIFTQNILIAKDFVSVFNKYIDKYKMKGNMEKANHDNDIKIDTGDANLQ